MKQFLGKMKDWFVEDGHSNDEVSFTKEGSIIKWHRESVDPNKIELIIVSDNHMKTEGLRKVLTYYGGNVDYFLHCGDSNLDHDHELMRPFITVKGNTDYRQQYQSDEKVELENGELIWITHGHQHHVGGGVLGLLEDSKVQHPIPSIILYGHTHVVDVQMIADCLIINPGSIALPRDGIKRTYAKLVVTPELYEVSILDVKDHRVIKEFQFPR